MKKKISVLLIGALCFSLLAGCGAKEEEKTYEKQEKASLSGISYASEAETQVCDVYLPERTEPVPVIIVVHGGGFAFGDQGMPIIQPVIDKGLENGYAVVSVDYRKSNEATFPAALGDVKAAVRYVRANAERWGVDADRIAIWGESAGAYLSLMTALTPDVEELNADVTENEEFSSSVRALVDFYGPVEFYTLDDEATALGMEGKNFGEDKSFESQFLGQSLNANKDATYQTYWETYKEELPKDYELSVWIQVGDADQNVPYTQSQHFAERLADVIGEENVKFSMIEGAAHEDLMFYTDENLAEVFEFLDGVMK